MSLDYSAAKISQYIEDQVPSYVRKDGQKFVDFIKAYYDWMERRFVILTLSSDTAISGEDLVGLTLSQTQLTFVLQDEENANNILVAENYRCVANTIILSTDDYLELEEQEQIPLEVKIISYIPYNNEVSDGIYGERLIAFAEYIGGRVEENTIIYSSNTGSLVYISSYIDVKSPINIINNLESSQEIDYVMDYRNVIYNAFYINAWKELMFGFPLELAYSFDKSTKNIIVKSIKDLYKTKGTFLAVKYLFKILYNEDLIIGTDLYSDGLFSYVIKSDYYSAQIEIIKDIKRILHPVGYNITVLPK